MCIICHLSILFNKTVRNLYINSIYSSKQIESMLRTILPNSVFNWNKLSKIDAETGGYRFRLRHLFTLRFERWKPHAENSNTMVCKPIWKFTCYLYRHPAYQRLCGDLSMTHIASRPSGSQGAMSPMVNKTKRVFGFCGDQPRAGMTK